MRFAGSPEDLFEFVPREPPIGHVVDNLDLIEPELEAEYFPYHHVPTAQARIEGQSAVK